MTKYTRDELFAFIWRADTPEKIAVAEKWITAHVEDNGLWEDLMVALSIENRNYYREKAGRPLI